MRDQNSILQIHKAVQLRTKRDTKFLRMFALREQVDGPGIAIHSH